MTRLIVLLLSVCMWTSTAVAAPLEYIFTPPKGNAYGLRFTLDSNQLPDAIGSYRDSFSYFNIPVFYEQKFVLSSIYFYNGYGANSLYLPPDKTEGLYVVPNPGQTYTLRFLQIFSDDSLFYGSPQNPTLLKKAYYAGGTIDYCAPYQCGFFGVGGRFTVATAPAPELQTWTMMVIAFALIGARLRLYNFKLRSKVPSAIY